ncbi:NADP-dependent oxidoreductase domain-containing protein [Ustulina deusta]|nr:NADP-dependent oxidoreductase domain-containing protein [Ustulina deusta]
MDKTAFHDVESVGHLLLIPSISRLDEGLLGEARELSRGFAIDTKRPEGVNVLYIHCPDPTTPLEEQTQGFAEQIAKGHCKTISNAQPGGLKRMLRLCEQNAWPKLSCYQGTRNAISRGMETKLWPILQTLNMKLAAFWAVAAGFLAGKLYDDNPRGKQL